jgi:hypothetical protein
MAALERVVAARETQRSMSAAWKVVQVARPKERAVEEPFPSAVPMAPGRAVQSA